jgi:hypothetical protein
MFIIDASSRVNIPHGESTLESFIERGDEYTCCENVLDDPTFAGEVPPWLRWVNLNGFSHCNNFRLIVTLLFSAI